MAPRFCKVWTCCREDQTQANIDSSRCLGGLLESGQEILLLEWFSALLHLCDLFPRYLECLWVAQFQISGVSVGGSVFAIGATLAMRDNMFATSFSLPGW